jgi:hypothetical protein
VHVPLNMQRVEPFDAVAVSVEEPPCDRGRGARPCALEPRLRTSQHACTEDVHPVNDRRADSVASDWSIAVSVPASPSGNGFPRHVVCNFASTASAESTDNWQANTAAKAFSLFAERSEAKRGPVSRPVPSVPSLIPDFRNLAGFEWEVRQPTRREAQCVPN